MMSCNFLPWQYHQMLIIHGTHFCKFWQKHNQQVNQDKQTAPTKKKNQKKIYM